ncbi:hypothetical protein BDFB_002728 [Asbolus verrucosus]|uniref:Uncharacterized protein n=1 Tax=Asbolus verrucosus TaxID=1661398 RepID=A0A482W8I2_ASBVE|nr:hypothetical protein BDFB_002728 [Asbolus verrucosus]
MRRYVIKRSGGRIQLIPTLYRNVYHRNADHLQ